jgi:hypothetical protein
LSREKLEGGEGIKTFLPLHPSRDIPFEIVPLLILF